MYFAVLRAALHTKVQLVATKGGGDTIFKVTQHKNNRISSILPRISPEKSATPCPSDALLTKLEKNTSPLSPQPPPISYTSRGVVFPQYSFCFFF